MILQEKKLVTDTQLRMGLTQHTVPRDFGIYLSVIAKEYGFGRNQPVCE
jgi:hypothetical protein